MNTETIAINQSETTDFLSLEAMVGDSWQLQEIENQNNRYAVTLIGFSNKHALIVSHPTFSGHLLYLKTGNTFLVRGFSGRNTYEFESAVINVNLNPFPHLCLTFPNEVQLTHMRNALRIRRQMPCEIQQENSEILMEGKIMDISTSGTRIEAETNLGELGSNITVIFTLPLDGEDYNFAMPAIIRNLKTTPTETIMHGIQFVSPEGKIRIALQNFIYRSLAEN